MIPFCNKVTLFKWFRLFLSRSIIAPRLSSTSPSSEKLLSIRATASRAELMCWAICSWVMRMVLEPVRSASARRNYASRRSNPLNMICCIAHITSENRFVANS